MQFVGALGYYTGVVNRAYVVARFYRPDLGRWQTRDPIGFEGGDWNVYCYVASRPTAGVDPSGLDWLDCFASCIQYWDPIEMAFRGMGCAFRVPGCTRLAAFATMPIPKWLARRLGCRTTRFAGGSRLTSLLSCLQQMVGRRGVGGWMRHLGRLLAGFTVAYGVSLAVVEAACAGACLAQPDQYFFLAGHTGADPPGDFAPSTPTGVSQQTPDRVAGLVCGPAEGSRWYLQG